MKYLKKFQINESLYGDYDYELLLIKKVFEIASNYEEINPIICIDELMKLDDTDLDELYKSLSSNIGDGYNNNSDDENFKLDIINELRKNYVASCKDIKYEK